MVAKVLYKVTGVEAPGTIGNGKIVGDILAAIEIFDRLASAERQGVAKLAATAAVTSERNSITSLIGIVYIQRCCRMPRAKSVPTIRFRLVGHPFISSCRNDRTARLGIVAW